TVSVGAVLTRASDTSIASLADLKGKTTAQSTTSNWAGVARGAGAKVEPVEGLTQAVALVKQDRVDATVNDQLSILSYLKTSNDKSVKLATTTDDKTEQALAMPKGSPLTAKIDKALADLRANGTLAKISQKYFSTDVSK